MTKTTLLNCLRPAMTPSRRFAAAALTFLTATTLSLPGESLAVDITTDDLPSTVLEEMPTFDGEPMLVAGVRRGALKNRWSKTFGKSSKADKVSDANQDAAAESNEKAEPKAKQKSIEPKSIQPSTKADTTKSAKPIPSNNTAKTTRRPLRPGKRGTVDVPNFENLFDDSASVSSTKPAAKAKPAPEVKAELKIEQPRTQRPAQAVAKKPVAKKPAAKKPAAQSAVAQKPTSKETATSSKSVEDHLRELYARDGREMPDIEYRPVPADNPAVRAARKARGLPEVPVKKKPASEPYQVVELNDIDLTPQVEREVVRMERDDFFPGDATPPAETNVASQPKPQAADLPKIAPQKRGAVESAVASLEPAVEQQPAAEKPTVEQPVTKPAPAVAAKPATVKSTIAKPNIDSDWEKPKRVPAWTARTTTPQAGWRPALPTQDVAEQQVRTAARPATAGEQVVVTPIDADATGLPVSADAIEKTIAPQPVAQATPVEAPVAEPTPVNEPVEQQVTETDPLADTFAEDEANLATNERLDLDPPAVDMTAEPASVQETPAETAVVNNEPIPTNAPNAKSLVTGREGLTGLKGFCPVTLCKHRNLIDADPRFAAVYQDRTYYVSSEEALEQFQKDPSKYAPVLGGLDIVRVNRDAQQVEGILDHAAWYRGKLYLFESAETLAEFSANPLTYAVR